MSKYFKTSDGEEFYTENHACNHARSLTDKTVTPPTIVVEEQEETTATEAAFNFSKMTKKQLIEFAAMEAIEVDEKSTNAIIITTIEDALAATAANDLEVDVDADEETPKTEE